MIDFLFVRYVGNDRETVTVKRKGTYTVGLWKVSFSVRYGEGDSDADEERGFTDLIIYICSIYLLRDKSVILNKKGAYRYIVELLMGFHLC